MASLPQLFPDDAVDRLLNWSSDGECDENLQSSDEEETLVADLHVDKVLALDLREEKVGSRSICRVLALFVFALADRVDLSVESSREPNGPKIPVCLCSLPIDVASTTFTYTDTTTQLHCSNVVCQTSYRKHVALDVHNMNMN